MVKIPVPSVVERPGAEGEVMEGEKSEIRGEKRDESEMSGERERSERISSISLAMA